MFGIYRRLPKFLQLIAALGIDFLDFVLNSLITNFPPLIALKPATNTIIALLSLDFVTDLGGKTLAIIAFAEGLNPVKIPLLTELPTNTLAFVLTNLGFRI